MKKATRFVGLDVHAETIAVAVAEPGRAGEVRSSTRVERDHAQQIEGNKRRAA
jgi:hypothetical protein